MVTRLAIQVYEAAYITIYSAYTWAELAWDFQHAVEVHGTLSLLGAPWWSADDV